MVIVGRYTSCVSKHNVIFHRRHAVHGICFGWRFTFTIKSCQVQLIDFFIERENLGALHSAVRVFVPQNVEQTDLELILSTVIDQTGTHQRSHHKVRDGIKWPFAPSLHEESMSRPTIVLQRVQNREQFKVIFQCKKEYSEQWSKSHCH